MNTFRTNSSLRRAAGVVILGALVLGGTFATAAAFSGSGSSGVEDPASPAPSRAPVVTPTPAPIVTPGPSDARPGRDARTGRGRPGRGARAGGNPGAKARGNAGA